MHRYIKTEMDFMDIASLGTNYIYDVKMEHKFKRKRRESGSANSSQSKQGKGIPNQKKMDRENMVTLRTTSPSCNIRRVMKI
jgi:hypothetical protein